MSNQRQDAFLESDEEEITAERPTIIAGSHLACSDLASQGLYKKVICRISDEVDLDNINLENLSIRVNERQIPISVNPEGDFEIVVAQEEKIDTSAVILIDNVPSDEHPTSHPKSADQQVEPNEESSNQDNDTDDDPTLNNDNMTSDSDDQMPSEDPQTSEPNSTPGIMDIASVSLNEGLSEDGSMNVVAFDKHNDVLDSIEDFDNKYKSNTFDINSIDKKDKDILPDLSKLVTFRIETYNTELSKGAVIKINDMVFGDSQLPNPQQLYSSAASGRPEILTLSSLKVVVSPDASKDDTLWSSSEECVEDDKKGDKDKIRDGALTIRIFDETDELFWELSIYVESDDCDDKKGKR
ncbi:MAG: hypothetical protein AB8G05_24680 [Oligoflexales bacterium]